MKLEKECKYVTNEDGFKKLTKGTANFKEIYNLYFDTPDRSFYNNGDTLRIRMHYQECGLHFKKQIRAGSIRECREYSTPISHFNALKAMENPLILKDYLKDIPDLSETNLDGLQYEGKLHVLRFIRRGINNSFMYDAIYLDSEVLYEVEIEEVTPEDRNNFEEYCEKQGIKIEPSTISKYQRLIQNKEGYDL